MIRRQASLVALVLLLLTALLAPACRQTPTPSPGVTPSPTPAAPAPPPRSAPTPVAAPRPEGELRLGWTTLGSEVLDPTLTPVSGIKQHGVLLYDFLVGATPEGQSS